MRSFLPWEKMTSVGPDARKFNRYQSEHPKVSYSDIIKTLNNPTKTLLASPTPKKVLVLEEVPSSSKQETLSGKQTKKQTSEF